MKLTESYILNKTVLWEYQNKCATCPYYTGLQSSGGLLDAEGNQV
jgi:hypothetical protein